MGIRYVGMMLPVGQTVLCWNQAWTTQVECPTTQPLSCVVNKLNRKYLYSGTFMFECNFMLDCSFQGNLVCYFIKLSHGSILFMV